MKTGCVEDLHGEKDDNHNNIKPTELIKKFCYM